MNIFPFRGAVASATSESVLMASYGEFQRFRFLPVVVGINEVRVRSAGPVTRGKIF